MKKNILLFIMLGVFSSNFAQLIINEVLYDPSNSGLSGDANGDGTYDQEDDSFIEFLNYGSTSFDASGYQIWDDTTSGSLRYTIPPATIVPPFGALVVFGGGTPTGTFGGAIVLNVGGGTAMSLGNSGEIIVIKNASGNTVLTFDSDALSGNPNESYTRNPDYTGNFEQHNDNTALLFSPGTKIDGTPFSLELGLSLAGIMDFDIGATGGKAIHLTSDLAITDLSVYSIGIANNGGGSDSIEYNFPAIATAAGDKILLVRDSLAILNYFGNCMAEFDHILVGNSDLNMNGDDAIELFEENVVIEVYGDINIDGTGEVWEYTDSWAFKDMGAWTYGGADCSLGSLSTQSSSCPYPICPLVTSGALALTGVMDFDQGAIGGKGIHLTASSSIPDLSIYAIGIANNGGGSDGVEYTFPAISVSSGDELLIVRDSLEMLSYLGTCISEFDYIFVGNNDINQNGNDAIELFENTIVIEVYGDINVDGTGEVWEYSDSWAYKDMGVWTYGGINCSNGSQTTQSSFCPYPVCPCILNVWNGSSSADWNDATNWTCGVVPTNACNVSDNVFVKFGSANTLNISGGVGAGNLEIDTNTSFIVNGSLAMCGDFIHNGNPITGTGGIELMGSAAQTISGAGTVNNLKINNAMGASVLTASEISISSSLELEAGMLSNNGAITLRSDASGTAYLNDFSAGFTGTYSGNITVERFVTPGSVLGQRFFGSAVGSSSTSGLDMTYASGYPQGAYVTPLVCNVSLDPTSAYSNLFHYEQSNLVGSACDQDGWFALNPSATLEVGRGYSGWMNDGSVLSVTGMPNTGSVDFITSGVSGSGIAGADGWHLLSNPYPSPLDANAYISAGFTSLQTYDGGSGPFHGTFNPVLMTGNELAVMQGFFAENTGGSATATVTNADRIASSTTTWFSTSTLLDQMLTINLTGNGYADKTYVYYADDSYVTSSFDDYTDCKKRSSDAGQPTIYSSLNNNRMSLNGFPTSEMGNSVPFGVAHGTDGNFELSFEGMTDFPANTTIYLEDKQAGVYHNLTNGNYAYAAMATDDSDRFELHFVLPIALVAVNANCAGDAGKIQLVSTTGLANRDFVITDVNNTIASGLLNTLDVAVAEGTYSVSVNDAFGGNQTYNVIVEADEAIEAFYEVSSIDVQVGEVVSFNNLTTNATSVEWNIGNITFLNGVNNATYSFDEVGSYDVELNVSSDDCSDSKVFTVNVSNKSTSVTTLDGDNALKVYSNENVVVLEFLNSFEGNAIVEVQNVIGQKVFAGTLDADGIQRIAIKDVTTGYYFIAVNVDGKSISSKLLLTRD